MKEYPISFLVRLQPKHKNIIKAAAKKYKMSEAEYVRRSIIFPKDIEQFLAQQ